MFEEVSWDALDAQTPGAQATDDAGLEALLRQVELGPPAFPSTKPAARPSKKPTTTTSPDAARGTSVELGFTSACPEGYSTPTSFPSKVGGAPVWLDPRHPPARALACTRCGRRLRFVLQLYCPRPELPHAYHRSLLLFCCGGECLRTGAGWRAFRCVLPAETPLYVERPDGAFSHVPESVLGAGMLNDTISMKLANHHGVSVRQQIGKRNDTKHTTAPTHETHNQLQNQCRATKTKIGLIPIPSPLNSAYSPRNGIMFVLSPLYPAPKASNSLARDSRAPPVEGGADGFCALGQRNQRL